MPDLAAALRIQVAAVAAQQIANDDAEIRLAEQAEQAGQAAAELEEKRRQLLLLSERTQTELAALQHERHAYERHVERITGDLSQPQRALLAAEKQVEAERERVARLQHRLRQRWHQHWKRKQRQYQEGQQQLARLAASLAGRDACVAAAERTLAERRLRFNGDFELARLHVQESWANLRQAQLRWKQRRGLERAALRVRGRDLDLAAQQVARARTQLERDQRAWHAQRQALELELDGLNTRVENQRRLLDSQAAALRALESQLESTQQKLAGLPGETPGSDTAAAPDAAAPDAAAPDAVVPNVAAPALAESPACAPPPPAPATVADAKGHVHAEASIAVDPQRVIDLDRLAQDLADQRSQLLEAWERLARVHDQWHADCAVAAAALEAMGARLLERDLLVQAREQAGAHAEQSLRERHRELLRLQEQLIAWRARLHTEENAWDSDKERMLVELRGKEDAAERQLAMLADLRLRWARCRQQEVEELRSERDTVEAFRKEFAKLRLELLHRAAALEEEKRALAEKSLALEQYREETLGRTGDPQAERRLERLRRRWVTQNAEAIRNISRERAALYAELKAVEQRYDELQRRAAELAEANAELTEKQTAWDEQQVVFEAHRARLENDLQHAQEQRVFAEQQLVAMREEVEHIARALLDKPDAPVLSLDQAA